MLTLSRRRLLNATTVTLAASAVLSSARRAHAQADTLRIHTAVKDGQFMVYGAGVAAYVKNKTGIQIDVVESTGSLDNLRAVDASALALGTVFMGSALDAVNGTGPFAGTKLTNVRALFPMYETSFQTAALAGRGITAVRDLGGKRVGVGPKGGPAEVFFRGLSEIAGIAPIIVNGNPADQGKQLMNGEIDAFWQGSIVPIPPLKVIADATETVIIGVEERDIAAMLARFPALAATTVPAGSYRGQATALSSVAAWNFVLAHKDLPEAVAAQVTRAVMSSSDPAKDIHASAVFTRRENASRNTIVPFHGGAVAVYRDMGITVRAL
jgi:uncharacterized protein